MITVFSQEVSINALVDTGSSVNLLRRDIFDSITARTHQVGHLRKSPPLQGVNGLSLDVMGQTQVRIAGIREPIEVVIAKDLPYEMIIGDPLLRHGRAVINFHNNTLRWFRRTWIIQRQKRSDSCSIGPVTPKTGNKAFDELMRRNADVFSAKGETNGTCTLTALTIKTNSAPINQKAYRTPLNKRLVVEAAIDEMLADGVIEPSCSPWASPITLVPKSDNTIRFCVDYRRLNSVTEKDTYPLPLIQDIFDQMGGSVIFSTLDLKAGYWQLPVAEEDIPKTAFRCHKGLFQFKVMPFGLCNAPAVFQRTMDYVLSGLIGACVQVYLDDIIVYSRNASDHERHLQCVFDRLRMAGLRLKPTKCSFGLSQVKLLGYILDADGIRADPEKARAINDLQPPTTVREVRSFLGMTGYYRQCMPGYARIEEPLIRLTRKHARFEWDKSQQEAFDTLKQLLMSSHVMTAPDTSRPYKLYTDACDYAVGGILVQEDSEGIEKVIQYISHVLSPTQRKWAVIEREAYAVVYAITKLRPYLFGAQFTVYTDHKPLKSLFTKEMNNTKVQRWGVLLADYGAVIEYRRGKNNIRADMLSRIHNRTVAVIDTDDWVDPHAIPTDNTADILPLIHDGLDLTVVAKIQQTEFPELWLRARDDDDECYQLIKGVLYSDSTPARLSPTYPRLVLPKTYQGAIIDRAHKETGHMAYWKTLQRVCEAYVWQGMRQDIRTRLRGCSVCAANSRRTERTLMGEMPLATYPMQIIGADLIGPLPESVSGNRYALTIIDHCTGWAEAYPIKNKNNQTIWEVFAREYIPRHGIPEILITDNGGEFTALEWEKYLRQIGVDHHRTTPMHPSSNGRCERFNRTFKELLQRLVKNTPSQWEDRLGDALMAYRTSVSLTTGHAPFFLLYSRRNRLPLTRTLQTNRATAFGNRLDDQAIALQTARALTEDSRRYNRERLAKKANANDIAVGDSVLLKSEDRIPFTSRWDPQWEVTRVRGPVLWLRNQQTGYRKVRHREKVVLADPTQNWDDHKPRPLRASYRPRAREPYVPRERHEPADYEPVAENEVAPQADYCTRKITRQRRDQRYATSGQCCVRYRRYGTRRHGRAATRETPSRTSSHTTSA